MGLLTWHKTYKLIVIMKYTILYVLTICISACDPSKIISSDTQQKIIINTTYKTERFSLIGTWQADTNLLGADLKAHYRFFNNSKFFFGNSMVFGLNQMKGFGGSYYVKDDKIIMTPKYYLSYNIQTISHAPFLSDSFSWMLGGSGAVDSFNIKCDDAILDFMPKDSSIVYISNARFFKMSSDPNFLNSSSQ
jgi:hypothetical protein